MTANLFALILGSPVTFCSERGDESFREERLSPHIRTFFYVTNTENSVVFSAFLSINLENTFDLNILKTYAMIF